MNGDVDGVIKNFIDTDIKPNVTQLVTGGTDVEIKARGRSFHRREKGTFYFWTKVECPEWHLNFRNFWSANAIG